MTRWIKLALIAFVVWYVFQDGAGAGSRARLLANRAGSLVTHVAYAGKDFLDGLIGK